MSNFQQKITRHAFRRQEKHKDKAGIRVRLKYNMHFEIKQGIVHNYNIC